MILFKKNKQKIDAYSKQELKKIKKIVQKIEKLREETIQLTDEQLKEKTNEFRFRLQTGETLDDILPEAFAVVREADRRILGKEPYPVQLIGGVLLHQGRVAELKTGEGKTLLGTLPAYLNALTGRGVHIVTVNEYLAKRDSDEMRQVHEFLGLTVGCIFSKMMRDERQKEYACDITYVTNSEIGFDYLRDNMVRDSFDRVQRGLVYAIVDEVDSVLIDEARTPLIISGAGKKDTLFYGTCDILAKRLKQGEASSEFNKSEAILGNEIVETGDFIVDQKDKTIHLTDAGLKKCEAFLHIQNLTTPENLKFYHGIMNALQANHLMKRDVDYIVKNGEVLIIDTFTGRILDGRRYEDGLHQALEAKERVKIKEKTKTLAGITYQSFFNKYEKKCGMTGTGKTEEKEFQEIYSMDVIEVPTNRPLIRIDMPDIVFKNEEDKWEAVCDEVESCYNRHQPILVGVVSVKKSEELSRMLSQRGIPHSLLNANNDALEAEIIARAGQVGCVTIATNMAGRGTDIKVSNEAKALGGLRVLGTEKHDSVRIDNQLRGRSGRQGDIGSSQFYLSLEDDLMKFADKRLLEKFNCFPFTEEGTSHKKVVGFVNETQKKIELIHYGSRKHVFDYDLVNSNQREWIYQIRNELLDGSLDNFLAISIEHVQKNTDFLLNLTEDKKEKFENLSQFKMIEKSPESDTIEKNKLTNLALEVIDLHWQTHLERLDYLRLWIDVSAYAQRDPRFEYKKYADELFGNMLATIYLRFIEKAVEN